MRVLLGYEHIRRLTGAKSQVVTELGRRLVARGHDVTLICDTCIDPPLYPEFRIIARRAARSGDSQRLLRLQNWAMRIVPGIESDLAISFHPAIPGDVLIPAYGLAPTGASRKRGRVRGAIMSLPRGIIRRIVEWRALRHSALKHIVALSEAMHDSLLAAAPSIESKLQLIPGASPIEPPNDPAQLAALRQEARSILRLDDDAVVFLWPAKAPPRRLGRQVLDALADVVHHGGDRAMLIIACEKPWDLHDYSVDVRCDDQLRLISRTREMPMLLAAADAALIPADSSVYGRKVWEPLAFGLPVIAGSRTAGLERMRAADGRLAGEVVSMSKPGTLPDAMRSMLDEANLCRATRIAQSIAPTMRFDAFVDRLEALMTPAQRAGDEALSVAAAAGRGSHAPLRAWGSP